MIVRIPRIRYNIEQTLKWTNLNPGELIATMKSKEPSYDYYSLEEYFRRAGITSVARRSPVERCNGRQSAVPDRDRMDSSPPAETPSPVSRHACRDPGPIA